MSLSRPAKFPLLKLPWLCIKCVLLNSDEFILIYFATISDRARRIVKSSNCSIKKIDVDLSGCGSINIIYQLGNKDNKKTWFFAHGENAKGGDIILQIGSQPIRTCRHFDTWGDRYLHSYTAGDKLDALKMGIEFMIDVFGCTIGQVTVYGNNLSKLFGLGISTVEELTINYSDSVNLTDLKFLLENIRVTDEYEFHTPIPANFSCDPQIFKCRSLFFWCFNSADWFTLDLLCQVDVPQLNFWDHRFSKQDIVSYITSWFNSENRKLEFAQFKFNQISLGDFIIDHLNPLPFNEKLRNRCPFVGEWKDMDMSSGMDILRQDGLLATIFVKPRSILFYIWHKRFPDTN